jgi:hypothetical protein
MSYSLVVSKGSKKPKGLKKANRNKVILMFTGTDGKKTKTFHTNKTSHFLEMTNQNPIKILPLDSQKTKESQANSSIECMPVAVLECLQRAGLDKVLAQGGKVDKPLSGWLKKLLPDAKAFCHLVKLLQKEKLTRLKPGQKLDDTHGSEKKGYLHGNTCNCM